MSLKFFPISKAVSGNIQKFSYNTQQVEKYVAKIGTPQDSANHRTELHRLTHITEELAQQITQQLTELATSSSNQRDIRVQAKRLSGEFHAALSKFQQQQHKIVARERSSLARARLSSGQTDSVTSIEQAVPEEPGQLTEYETAVDIEAIQARAGEINRLEGSITNLNQIFKDLALIVQEQDEVIDNIETNIQRTQTNVQETTVMLGKAVTLKTASRKKKLILILVLVGILAVLGLIIGLAIGLR